MKLDFRVLLRFHIVGLAVLFACVPAMAQEAEAAQKPPASLTGKYQGTAKSANRELSITLDLVDNDGVFSGTVVTQFGTFKVVKGKLVEGLLTLETEGNRTTGKFSLRVKGDKLEGALAAEGGSGIVDLRRVMPDEISGEWDAAADVRGQAFPFVLNLKLDGEKVTGTSSSQLGNSNVSSGAWKEGKLALVVDSANGAIGLVASIVDGKLVGDYDFAGQLQGKWVGIRKK